MRALITSDLHLSANPRDEYRHEFMGRLRKMIAEHKVNTLLILGDLTEQKDKHESELVNRVVGHIDRLAQLVDKLIILRGNHDWLNDPSMPFFRFLGKLPNVTWINNPTMVGALFLPHTTNYAKDWAKYIDSGFDGVSIVFAHNTFDGTLGDNGHRLDGVPPSIFPKRLTVVSGDVHGAQNVGPVIYVGAPYTVDFGDDYAPRVLLWDENGRLDSIPCRGPQKELLEVKSVTDLQKAARLRGLQEGDILKVRVTIDRAETAVWAEMREEVRAWGAKQGYLIHVVQPVVEDAQRRLDTAKRRRVSKSDDQLFGDYCRRIGIDDKTAAVGRKIMGG